MKNLIHITVLLVVCVLIGAEAEYPPLCGTWGPGQTINTPNLNLLNGLVFIDPFLYGCQPTSATQSFSDHSTISFTSIEYNTEGFITQLTVTANNQTTTDQYSYIPSKIGPGVALSEADIASFRQSFAYDDQGRLSSYWRPDVKDSLVTLLYEDAAHPMFPTYRNATPPIKYQWTTSNNRVTQWTISQASSETFDYSYVGQTNSLSSSCYQFNGGRKSCSNYTYNTNMQIQLIMTDIDGVTRYTYDSQGKNIRDITTSTFLLTLYYN